MIAERRASLIEKRARLQALKNALMDSKVSPMLQLDMWKEAVMLTIDLTESIYERAQIVQDQAG